MIPDLTDRYVGATLRSIPEKLVLVNVVIIGLIAIWDVIEGFRKANK